MRFATLASLNLNHNRRSRLFLSQFEFDQFGERLLRELLPTSPPIRMAVQKFDPTPRRA